MEYTCNLTSIDVLFFFYSLFYAVKKIFHSCVRSYDDMYVVTSTEFSGPVEAIRSGSRDGSQNITGTSTNITCIFTFYFAFIL